MSHETSPPTVAKPETPHDYRGKCPDGKDIDFHSDPRVSGAWLRLGPHTPGSSDYPSLSVQCVKFGAEAQHYAGYRDGKAQSEKVAICADDDGNISLFVVLDGDTPERQRCRTVPLRTVLKLIDAATEPPPAPKYS